MPKDCGVAGTDSNMLAKVVRMSPRFRNLEGGFCHASTGAASDECCCSIMLQSKNFTNFVGLRAGSGDAVVSRWLVVRNDVEAEGFWGRRYRFKHARQSCVHASSISQFMLQSKNFTNFVGLRAGSGDAVVSRWLVVRNDVEAEGLWGRRYRFKHAKVVRMPPRFRNLDGGFCHVNTGAASDECIMLQSKNFTNFVRLRAG